MANKGMAQTRKDNTRNRILYIIRRKGSASKIEIKRISNYSMATVLDIVEHLKDSNLITYKEKVSVKSGRRPTAISINPDGGYFLGISFNASVIYASLLDFSGIEVDNWQVPFETSPASAPIVLRQIKLLMQQVLSEHESKLDRIFGIGVGSPGYVDEATGNCIFYPHIEGWCNIPLLAELTPFARGIPIEVENNVGALAFAYKWLCPIEGEGASIIISIRNGVRMSCIINSLLYRGKDNTAGEIGHNKVNGGNRYCPCGNRGCLETEISEPAVINKILEGVQVGRFSGIWELAGKSADNVTLDLFFQSVREGQPDSLALLEDICTYLGASVAQLINTLNPSRIIFHARLCELGDIFFTCLRKQVEAQAIFVAMDGVTLESMAFGNNSAAIGAAAIAMERELGFVNAII